MTAIAAPASAAGSASGRMPGWPNESVERRRGCGPSRLGDRAQRGIGVDEDGAHRRPQPGRPRASAIASPRRIARPGCHSGLKREAALLANSSTTVEPSMKRPISSPCFSDTCARRHSASRGPAACAADRPCRARPWPCCRRWSRRRASSTNAADRVGLEHADDALVAREQARHAARRRRVDREQRARARGSSASACRRTACGCGGSPSGSGRAWRSCRRGSCSASAWSPPTSAVVE